MSKSDIEQYFALQVKAAKLPAPETEHRFHPVRRWRFDFAWREYMVAAEIQGGTFTQGRHTRGVGYQADCDKLNAAQLLGWVVFHGTAKTVKSGELLDFVTKAIKRRGKRSLAQL